MKGLRYLLLVLLISGAAAAPIDDALRAYESGDYSTALTVARPLAERGDSSAQALLGDMYLTGRGVVEDDGEGYVWHLRAARGGNARAQTEIAFYYSSFENDHSTALRYLHLAADQHHAPAMDKLGQYYDLGWGVAQSATEAAKWYRLAAEQGYAPAQLVLGLRYGGGIGVPQDYVMAHTWLNLASGRFSMLKTMHPSVRLEREQNARNERDRIGSKMTREQIADAQRQAREWSARHRADP